MLHRFMRYNVLMLTGVLVGLLAVEYIILLAEIVKFHRHAWNFWKS